MSTIPTTGTVTFTIKSVPLTDGGFRTVERLMRLERGKQRTLKKLQKTRVNELNERRPRAGRMWLVRARCTRLVRCLLYTSPSPRDGLLSRMPSSA